MTSSQGMLALAVAGVAVALTGCLSDVTASSRSYLGPAGSGAVVNHPLGDTALEVTRLFELRGYAMVDQHVDAPNGERRLKFSKTNRTLAADKSDDELVGARDVGSVFYVWVTPDAAGTGSTVSLLGKPTLAGVEPCTQDGVVLACSKLTAPNDFVDRYLRARTEVEVVHGILSELELEGYVVRAMPPDAPPPTPDAEAMALAREAATCQAKRREAAAAASQEQDPYKRTALVNALPRCGDDDSAR